MKGAKKANKVGPQRITVNQNNLQTGIIYKHKNLVENINFWHKFVVINADNHKRNTILGAVLDHVHPLDLIPVSYSRDQSSAHFLARNCAPAITKLAKDNLTVPNPENPSKPFKLTLILKFATTTEFKVDVQKNIISVLTRRFDPAKKILNLTNFCEDPGLIEFCPLSQPKIMFFVLHLSKNLAPLPEWFILSNNRIKLLNPLDAITGVKMTYLDLSYNLIDNIDNLAPLKSFEITELVLDKNPICDTYNNTFTYVKNIELHCPKISVVDGVLLKDGSFPITKINFLCNPESYDVVNQFLEYFFTAYDSKNRTMLEGLYHKNAMFSLTSTYIPGQMSSNTAQLKVYNYCSRNLMKIADCTWNTKFLYRGSMAIIKIFNELPPTEHDPYSFQVDVIHTTPTCVVINISGVFRELPYNLLDPERYLGFSRVFVLQHEEQKYCIVNEQLHLYNALSGQVTTCFKKPRPLRVNVVPQAQTPKEQQQLTDALKIITKLDTHWSKKCLEECNYDLKSALALFISLYKLDKIPSEAFLGKM